MIGNNLKTGFNMLGNVVGKLPGIGGKFASFGKQTEEVVKTKGGKAKKTKKYTVTLNHKYKLTKKAKLTLKIGKKKYTATTNAKGKATFKITKLNKKGTYKGKITSKGTDYFKVTSKKVTIKIK